jgi:hypothetical protein
VEDLARSYRSFARDHARGQSEAYERLAEGIADDPAVLALLARMPRGNKRQPNLLFAAVRHLGGPHGDYAAFRSFVLDRWDDVAATMLARYTQTNEPARCAVLLPLLAALPQPLALLEVGASAGLCLHPDRYRYRYDDGREFGPSDSRVVFECRTAGPVPVPEAVPRVVWRAGIDLNPLDVRDEEDRRWLEALVWPGRPERTHRLRAAIDTVRDIPPRIVRGDLVAELPGLAAQAPPDATLVVFHTAVLTYLPLAERERFARAVRQLPGHWVSNEHPTVLPWLGGPVPDDPHLLTLALDERPVAFTVPHGQAVHWLG